MMRTKILFVCLGNICRSPMAEGVFLHLINKKNLSQTFEIDSAGTAAYHVGNLPDSRMRATALRHGIGLVSRARQFKVSDFEDFDMILAMDNSNFRNILALTKSDTDRAKVKLMREFDEQSFQFEDVPDPYYGGDAGFENVFQILERCCIKLLERLEINNTSS